MADNALSGQLPSEVGELHDKFTYLDLWGSGVQGKIPTEVRRRSSATRAAPRAATCAAPRAATRAIAASYSNPRLSLQVGLLTGLSRTYFGENSWSGGVPSELGFIGYGIDTYYTDVDISNTTIGGTIPTELFRFQGKSFVLSNSAISSTLPTQIGEFGASPPVSHHQCSITARDLSEPPVAVCAPSLQPLKPVPLPLLPSPFSRLPDVARKLGLVRLFSQ